MDDIWDEERWEQFFREADRRTELYVRLREAWVRAHPPPPESAPEAEHDAWHEALEQHLVRRMGWAAPLSDLPAEPPPPDEADAWKVGLADDFPGEQPVEALPVWQTAMALVEAAYRWARALPEDHHSTSVAELCAAVNVVAAKIANGHGMGYEPDVLGGNIAQAKRALAAANRALDALTALRDEPFTTEADYHALYEHAYEVRNAVGLHVQALRERFEAER